MQRAAEDLEEHRAEEEVGDRLEERGDRDDVVEPRAAHPTQQRSRHGAEQEADDRGDADEPDRPGQFLLEDGANWCAQRDRDAQVALEQLRDIGEVLVDQALVQPDAHGELDRAHLLGSDLAGERTDLGLDRIARHHPRQDEVDGHRHPQRERVETDLPRQESHRDAPWARACTSSGASVLVPAQPQLSRTTSAVGSTIVCGSLVGPSNAATSASTAASPSCPPD